MNSRQIREVQVADEVEAGVVNQLIGAYQVLFTAADLVDIAIVGKDHLRTSLRRAEFAVAGHNVQLAKRHLCKQVALSRRRGELIALAGHLADIGSSVAPFGAPADDEEEAYFRGEAEIGSPEFYLERASEHAAAIEAQVACVDCGTIFVDQEAAREHLSDEGVCPAEACRLIVEEDAEADNAEILDAQFGGNEADLPCY